jgi:UDP-N-acetylglucosamine:LPS N-acetylglucosamine transferase
MVSVNKKINALKKKRNNFNIIIQTQKAKLRQLKRDYTELKKDYEFYEFQTYDDI